MADSSVVIAARRLDSDQSDLARAGIHLETARWIPAFAGMTSGRSIDWLRSAVARHAERFGELA